jgi:hypothetical protein
LAHRVFLQGVQAGDLGAQQVGDRFVGVGVALVGELGHLREHAVGAVPALEDLLGQCFWCSPMATSSGQ